MATGTTTCMHLILEKRSFPNGILLHQVHEHRRKCEHDERNSRNRKQMIHFNKGIKELNRFLEMKKIHSIKMKNTQKVANHKLDTSERQDQKD